jgi:methyl-accepting chemotaxis protein
MLPLIDDVEKSAKVLAQREREALAVSGLRANSTIKKSRLVAFLPIGLNLLVLCAVLWLVRRVTTSFRQAVSEMQTGSDEVTAAAGQLATAGQSLAQRSSEQAASLQETSASSTRIGAVAHQNSRKSRAAAELVGQSMERFIETNRSLESMVQAMGEIKSQSGKISKIIKISFSIWRTLPCRIHRSESVLPTTTAFHHG